MDQSCHSNSTTGRSTTFDKDEHAEFHAAYWGELRIDQLSRGPFRATIDYRTAGGMLCYRERWNRRLLVRGVGPRNHLIIGIEYRPDFLWNGFPMDQQHVALLSTTDEAEFASGESADHIVLLVPSNLLRRHVGDEHAEKLLRNRRHLTLTDRWSRELARSVGCLLAGHQPESSSPGGSPRAEPEAESIEHELLGCLTQIGAAAPNRPFQSNRAKRRRVLLSAVERALQLQGPKPVPEFARELGVSQGTLETVIREALDITPARFLRWGRLNALKSELRSASPEALKVTEACHRWGFTELGRTAVEYRQLFGESPSETLAGPTRR